MRKIILIAHTSLDGFVAAENGDLEVLNQSPENLDFVCRLTENADGVLAGRVSFEMLDGYWPTASRNPGASSSELKYSTWYNASEKIVLSRSMRKKQTTGITIVSDNIDAEVKGIKNKTGKDILLFGSPGASQTLDALNLIDEYWIITYPIVLGKGIPLFARPASEKKLTFLNSMQFTQGELAIHYKIQSQG